MKTIISLYNNSQNTATAIKAVKNDYLEYFPDSSKDNNNNTASKYFFTQKN